MGDKTRDSKRRMFDGKQFESAGDYPTKEIAELTARIIQRDGTSTQITHSFLGGFTVWREVKDAK